MIKHDIHIHTHLSSCGERTAFMKGYIDLAAQLGLEAIGFADHAWDLNIPGASGWYSDQGYERLAARREELKEIDTHGIKVMLGAEGEYAQELLAISDEAAQYVDYIIVPHSHTHMRGFVLPADCVGDPEKHANYLVRSFLSLCRHEKNNMYIAVAHPMYPIGDSHEYVEKCYSFITDSMLEECAQAAKDANLMVEANLSVLNGVPAEGDNCYRRFFDACKKAGCDIFLGSDSHTVGTLEIHKRKESLVAKVGLNDDDFTAAERRILNG